MTMAFTLARRSSCSLATRTAATFLRTAAAATTTSRQLQAARCCSSSTELLLRKLSPSPMLMFPTPIEDAHDEHTTQRSYRLYSLVDRALLHVPIAIPDGILRKTSLLGPCNTTSVASISSHDCSMFVYHPFTQIMFFLPPFETLPFVTEKYSPDIFSSTYSYALRGYKPFKSEALVSDSYVKKLVVSGMCYAICGPERDLAYCRYGDTSWSYIGGLIPGSYRYYDVVHFKGEVYYALVRSRKGMPESYSVLRWDFGTCQSVEVPVDDSNSSTLPEKRYLVKSGREILMIVRYYCKDYGDSDDEKGDHRYVTKRFDVYKLNFGKRSWELVNSIGEYALFLGSESSFSLPVSSYSGLKKNCIYFTNDDEAALEDFGSKNSKTKTKTKAESFPDHDKYDFGIFNIGLDHNNIKTRVFSKSDQPPVWIVLSDNVKKLLDQQV